MMLMNNRARNAETYEQKQARRKAMTPAQRFYEDNHGVPIIRTYQAAADHYEAQGALGQRANGHRYLGDRRYKNRTMDALDDGSISIFYKDEHLITYHPDDTITVQGMSSQASGDPTSIVYPLGLDWTIGTRVGPIIASIPAGDAPLYEREGFHISQGWWAWLRMGKFDRKPHPLMIVFRAARPVHMTLVGGRWEPTNLDQVEPVRWTTFDTKRARGAQAENGIPDFVAAFDAFTALDGELPPYQPMTQALLLQAMKERDFQAVLTGLERTRRRVSGWGATAVHKMVIRPKALSDLRTKAIVEAGATFVKEQRLMTYPEYRNIETQLKRFGVPKDTVLGGRRG